MPGGATPAYLSLHILVDVLHQGKGRVGGRRSKRKEGRINSAVLEAAAAGGKHPVGTAPLGPEPLHRCCLACGPLLMCFSATFSPVSVSSASTTKPNAPRLTSFICRSGGGRGGSGGVSGPPAGRHPQARASQGLQSFSTGPYVPFLAVRLLKTRRDAASTNSSCPDRSCLAVATALAQ
jgi:hypothetical protein